MSLHWLPAKYEDAIAISSPVRRKQRGHPSERTITGENGETLPLVLCQKLLGIQPSLPTSDEHGESPRFHDERPSSMIRQTIRIIATIEETAGEQILNESALGVSCH